MTAPTSSFVASSFCSAGDRSTPREMNTIVSVFAIVQSRNATSQRK